MTLTGANTYSGGTQVSAGVLTAENAAALGTGQVLVTGGTLALSHTRLQLSGGYFQSAQGILQLGLGGTGLSQSDALLTQGSAALGGVLQVVSYGGFTPQAGNLFYVLQAQDGIEGKFSQVDGTIGGLRLLPVYYSNEVAVEAVVSSFGALGATGGQKAVGADLDGLFNNPNENTLMVSLAGLSAAQLQTALGQMSPEGLTGLYQSGFTQAVLEGAQVTRRLAQLRQDGWDGAGTAQAFSTGAPMFASTLPAQDEAAMISPRTDGWSGFAGASGGSFNVSGTGGYQTSSEGMVTAGMDRMISRNVQAGLMFSYGQVEMGLNGGGALGVQGGQVGLYGSWEEGSGFYVDSAVFGGPENISGQRNGYGGTAAGSTNGETYGGLVGLGYDLKTDRVTWGPAASLQYTRVGINGYSEQGSAAALVVPSQGADSLMSRLGEQAEGKWIVGGMVLKPGLDLSWEHEFDYQGGDVQAGFGQGDSFTVSGASVGQDGLLASAGLEAAFTEDFSLDLNYQSEIGRTNLSSSEFGGEVGLSL